jgi:uncharacterized protein YggE
MTRRPAAALLLATLVTMTMNAQEPPASRDQRRTVTVQGLGTVAVEADQARLAVQVATRAETASEAMTQASQKTSAVLKLLKETGVEPKDIQTSRVTVTPVIDYQRNIQPPPIVGYSGTNEFTVLFRGHLMEKTGTFMDRAVGAGVTGFGGIAFENSRQRTLERDALQRAATDARARAEVLAKELGASVGEAVRVEESVATPSPLLRTMAMADAAGGEAPVMKGELTITARVTVVFELR